ncbi:MAG: PIG-L family deacetylase [Thermoanaerobaculaceae bacterium]|jgi:LmbE family N-acetylglucosaminyl deacetylase|nr:PIG-L family deacetylase [Thermoanaerobaculaceae bacterium]
MTGTLQEAEIVPYAPGRLPGRRVLVLAPHPDDEVLGGGATLAAAAAEGCELTVVCVTSGGAQGEAGEREREAVDAARELQLPAPELWRLADRSLATSGDELCSRLGEVLARVAPDTVLTPSPVELHPDHRAVAWQLHRALRRRLLWGCRGGSPAWVAAYEVSVPILPNLLVAADATWEPKRRALACYRSQLAFRPYAAVMEGLGTFRTLTLPDCSRAEAFHVLPARVLARHTHRWWVSRVGATRVLDGSTADHNW